MCEAAHPGLKRWLAFLPSLHLACALLLSFYGRNRSLELFAIQTLGGNIRPPCKWLCSKQAFTALSLRPNPEPPSARDRANSATSSFPPTSLNVPPPDITIPRAPSFQSLAMTTATTGAGTPSSQPTQQAPLVATTITPQKTQQTTFFSSVFSPQVSSYFISGGCAGAASRTVVSPLERIKIIQSVLLLGFWRRTRGLMIRTTQQTGAAGIGRREAVPRGLEQSRKDMA
jgi:hypothetical protein